MSRFRLGLLFITWVAVGSLWANPAMFSAATRYGFTLTSGILTIRAFYRMYKNRDRKHS